MKFKNIKKKARNRKSPNNSRSIPASSKKANGGGEANVSTSTRKPIFPRFSFPKIDFAKLVKLHRLALKIVVASAFVVAVTIVGLDLQRNLQAKQNIDSQRESLTKELNFWKDFIGKQQNFPDAYFQASILEYRLGDISKAKEYLEKGLILDPNSESGRKIKKFLVNK